jgi:hypothetical protein
MPIGSRSVRNVAFLVVSCVVCCAGAVVLAQEQQPALTVSQEKLCADPRPQFCNEVYQPVCGYEQNGSYRTYSNACFACAEPRVVRSTPGKCKKN